MTDVTDLGEIEVRGQRRRPGGSFPRPPGSGTGGGGGGNEGGVEQNELDPNQPEQPPSEPHRCDNPETALDWNADAAAAEALRRMQQDANDPLLDRRERCMVLVRNDSGNVDAVNLDVGPPGAGTCNFILDGVNPANLVGLIQSHPGTGPYPSSPDRRDVYPHFQNLVAQAGGPSTGLRFYMAGTHSRNQAPRLQIHVYNQTNMDGDEDNPGPEVNPDAMPCP